MSHGIQHGNVIVDITAPSFLTITSLRWTTQRIDFSTALISCLQWADWRRTSSPKLSQDFSLSLLSIECHLEWECVDAPCRANGLNQLDFFFFRSLCSETISFATHSDQSFYPIQRISARVSYVNVPHFPTGYFFFLRLPFQCLWLMERSFIIYDILTGPPGSFHFTFWRTAQRLFT